MTSEREGVRGLFERAVPFLREAGEPYEDDGSNEPLELARSIEDFLASRPSDEGALSSASLAFDGGREASPCPHTRKEACALATQPADAEQRARELLQQLASIDDPAGRVVQSAHNGRWFHEDAVLRAIVAALSQQPEATLLREQPCGCVLCVCEDEKQCHGCGARHCGNLTDHPAYVAQQPEARGVVVRPLSEWHEDHGPVVWWTPGHSEPAWIGSPLDSDWPGYHTHWTAHPEVPATLTEARNDR